MGISHEYNYARRRAPAAEQIWQTERGRPVWRPSCCCPWPSPPFCRRLRRRPRRPARHPAQRHGGGYFGAPAHAAGGGGRRGRGAGLWPGPPEPGGLHRPRLRQQRHPPARHRPGGPELFCRRGVPGRQPDGGLYRLRHQPGGRAGLRLHRGGPRHHRSTG